MARIYVTPEHNQSLHPDIIAGIIKQLEASCRTPQGRKEFAENRQVVQGEVVYTGRVQLISQDVQFTITAEQPTGKASTAKLDADRTAAKQADQAKQAAAKKAAPAKAAAKKAGPKKAAGRKR